MQKMASADLASIFDGRGSYFVILLKPCASRSTAMAMPIIKRLAASLENEQSFSYGCPVIKNGRAASAVFSLIRPVVVVTCHARLARIRCQSRPKCEREIFH